MADNKYDVEIRHTRDCAIMKTDGYLNSPGGETLAEAAQGLIDEGNIKLVINLEQTRLINSIGISILIEIIELLEERDGVLNFCGLTPVIERTFRMMGIAQHAGIFPDEASAISNL